LSKSVEADQFALLKAQVEEVDYRDSMVSNRVGRMLHELEEIGRSMRQYSDEELDALVKNDASVTEQAVAAIKKRQNYLKAAKDHRTKLEGFFRQLAQKRKNYRNFLESGDFSRYTEKGERVAREYIDALREVEKACDVMEDCIDDIKAAQEVFSHNYPELKLVKLSHKEVNVDYADPAWEKYPKEVKDSTQVYSNFDYYDGIVAFGRSKKDGTDAMDADDLRSLAKADRKDGLLPAQESLLKEYDRIIPAKNGKPQRTMTDREALRHLSNLQKAAVPVDKNILLLRRVHDFKWCHRYKIGMVAPWNSVTSTFGTLEAFNDPKCKELFGECEIEIRVPAGSYIIPIGNHGTSWHSLDEIALPAYTAVRILEFSKTSTPPKMVVEVIPQEPPQL
jgi:hypothetical protein